MKFSTVAIALVAVIYCLPASADFPNMPPVKEGLWKIHTVDTYPDQPTQDTTVLLCRSHAYDDSVRTKAKKLESQCTVSSDTTVGNKHSSTVSCKTGAFATVSKSTVTMSDNAYHTETEATMTMAGKTSDTKTVQDQTYMGACPAGMAPGDRKLTDGTIQRAH